MDDLDRSIAIENLELLMGDAQQRMDEADAADLNPADAYRLIFRKLGWADAEIERAINHDEMSYEEQLVDQVGSRAYATMLLRDALKQVEAELVEAAAQGNSPSP